LILVLFLLGGRVYAFSSASHICLPVPQNYWNIAFYILTDSTSILHRPALHDDVVHHGAIPDVYVMAIKDRALRFAEGLHVMSSGNIEIGITFYVQDEHVYIVQTEDISIQDIFANNTFFDLIDDTNRYDYIMIIHGDAHYGAGAYLQTLNNAASTHVGLSMFYPHWLDATYSGNPNNVIPGDLLPVYMYGVTWDFFTYLLLHEFLHALEDKARQVGVAFPLIHNDNGWYWARLYVGDGMGYGGANYMWSTEQRLPYYYAILNGIVPIRDDPDVMWGFTPQVFLRDRTHTPRPYCVPGEWGTVAPTEASYGMYYRMCVVCEGVVAYIPIQPAYYDDGDVLAEPYALQSFIVGIYVVMFGGVVVILSVVFIILKLKKNKL